MNSDESPIPDPPPTPPPPDANRVLESTDLLQGESEVFIQHGDEIYRLRLTRSGRLVLNK